MKQFALFGRKQSCRKQSSTYKTPISGRRLTLEILEDRSLLSATLSSASPLRGSPDVQAEVTPLNPLVENADAYNIDYRILESGTARVLGQQGVQYISSYTYCAPKDPIYLTLFEKAIERWEEIVAIGVPDVVYPYHVDETTELDIDDLYLYLGFSDSFTSASSLGSAVNTGYYRDSGLGLPATGSIILNGKYFVANPNETVQQVFYNTILHELAHSMGYNLSHMKAIGVVESVFGTPFELDNVLLSSSNYWTYVGDHGVQQYQATYPDSLVELSTTEGFLLETQSSNGAYATHPSSLLCNYYLYLNQRDGMNYLVSPSFNATITPLTLGVFEDLGYSVDYNFADPINSTSPRELVATSTNASVNLCWEKSYGDLSKNESTQATYTVERLDLLDYLSSGSTEEEWEVIATGVEGASYFDRSVVPGREYEYRVKANRVLTNKEVGVFRAQKGDVLSWQKDGESRFCIYALVNKGLDALEWTKVVSSTTSDSWQVSALSDLPYDKTTLYRVVAIGTTIEETLPSRAVDISIFSNAEPYIPEGYSQSDWNALKVFLEIQDSNGIKNGVKISGSSYNANYLDIMDGIKWSTVDGQQRLEQISWSNYDLVGVLDLSTCDSLRNLDVSNNRLTSVILQSPRLTFLDVSNNELGALDVSALPSLESFNCSYNRLSELSLSQNVELLTFDCIANSIDVLSFENNSRLRNVFCSLAPITNLDFRANKSLENVDVWNPQLEQIVFAPQYGGVVDLSASDDGTTEYCWKQDDQVIEDRSAWTCDGRDAHTQAIVSISDDSTQVIDVHVGSSFYKPNAPSDLAFGTLDGDRLEMSWIDRSTNELGFKVFYRVNDSSWKLAAVIPSFENKETVGVQFSRTATKISSDSIYSFRVLSYTQTPDGTEEIVSDPLEATFDPRRFLSPSVSILTDSTILVGQEVTIAVSVGNYKLSKGDVDVVWSRIDKNGNEELVDSVGGFTYRTTLDDLNCLLKAQVEYNNIISYDVSSNVIANVRPNAPTNLSLGKYDFGTLEVTWNDDSAIESGYEVYYQIDGGEWKLAKVLTSDAETSSSTGKTIMHLAQKVDDRRAYSFKVVAYAFDQDGNIQYSEPIEKKWVRETSLDMPSEIVIGAYDSSSEILLFSWTPVCKAAFYEVEYRQSSNGGQTWRQDWSLVQRSSETSRTATSVHLDRNYEFRVRACGGDGVYSEWNVVGFIPNVSSTINKSDLCLLDLTYAQMNVEEIEELFVQI